MGLVSFETGNHRNGFFFEKQVLIQTMPWVRGSCSDVFKALLEVILKQ